MNSKWIIDINLRAKTVKHLEKKVEESLCVLGLGKELLNVTPIA